MTSDFRTYGDLRLLSIEDAAPADWDAADATHLAVRLPASAGAEVEMQRRGYLFADRTLRATINLQRPAVDYAAHIRLPVIHSRAYGADVLRISAASFPDDRRFHIRPEPDPAVAKLILADWVARLSDPMLCLYKDKPVGFLDLEQSAEDTLFVHLAAVEERYRLAGAALSLYAAAAKEARERGFRRLAGCISSRNTAVMGLYAFLGAAFSDPVDIFLKEM